jgi:glycosyltransferase involved in cell wall biosynthesis
MTPTSLPYLDIIIPVYNEGDNIIPTLASIAGAVKTPARVLICYDSDDDNTLPAIRNHAGAFGLLVIEYVRNRGHGAHGAVLTGFASSRTPFVLVQMADDDYNAGIIDSMMRLGEAGCDVVCASRFVPGGSMIGCPWVKAMLARVGNSTLYHLARLPAHDASNGFRLFSRRAIDQISIESESGFCYSIELLVKCHRLGWRIGEVPSQWIERRQGASRFQVVKWLPAYLRWYAYAFATTYLRRGPDTVRMTQAALPAK